MTPEQFIKAKELDFIEGDNNDSFWGGVDTLGDLGFELFVTADKEGPSQKQVEIYLSFAERFKELSEEMNRRTYELIDTLEENRKRSFETAPFALDFVSVMKEGTESEIEVICGVSKGFFIFKKHFECSVGFSDNKIISFEEVK